MTVYGSGYYFDFRQLESFMASFWKYGSDVQVQWSGDPVDCAGESALYFELDNLINQIDQALNALASTSSGAALQGMNMCPDSLMSVGDTCLDFFIMAPTAGGVFAGNGRSSEPFANVHQSKLQFVPHFDNGTFDLLISGSLFATPLPSGHSWSVSLHYTPPSNWQIQRFNISAPTANQRIVELKIWNAECAALSFDLQNRGIAGELLDALTRTVCPTIDAEVHYTRLSNGNWSPEYVRRDPYPTLDIFEKKATGFHLLDHSEETWVGGLFGLTQLKYKIQRERDELLQDPTCQLQ